MEGIKIRGEIKKKNNLADITDNIQVKWLSILLYFYLLYYNL